MDACLLPVKPISPLDIDYHIVNFGDFSDIFGPLPSDQPSDTSAYDHNAEQQKTSKDNVAVGLEDFEVLKVVGEGGFGKVYQVRKVGSSEIYAMKVIPKVKIVKSERDILEKLDHPFIIHLRYSFLNQENLYLVLDFINGGNLLLHKNSEGLFREDTARIFAAEIVSAVSYLHANGILHRDLKPENILLDAEGHAVLTDFGYAKQFDDSKNTRSNSICGTLAFMAPEVVLGSTHHNKAADWWSLGIFLYEMMTGKQPFFCENRHKLKSKILREKVKIPSYLSSEAHSLLKGLLEKSPNQRLGSEEVRGHKWFRSINWKKLEAREIQPRFIPRVAGV